MKRYYFSALLLSLAAPACGHHGTQGGQQTARVAPDQTASYNTQQAERAANVFKEEPTGDEAREQAEADEGLPGYGDAAEHEKMELPEHSGNDATASSAATVIGTGRGESTSAASSYGNPPGAHTAPGSTRAITPTQGTAGIKPMEGERATDESVVAGVAGVAGAGATQGASSSDRTTTQRIRRAIMNDDSLSYTAKNVEVITRDGNISLRGKVMSDKERWEIERITRGYAGSGKVDNYLTIKTP